MRRLLLVASIALAASSAQAQQLVGIVPGDKVRITVIGTGDRYAGRLMAPIGDSIAVNVQHAFRSATPLALPMENVAKLELRRRDHVLGFAYGVGLGLLTALIFPVDSNATNKSTVYAVSIGATALVSTAFGVERWDVIPFTRRRAAAP